MSPLGIETPELRHTAASPSSTEQSPYAPSTAVPAYLADTATAEVLAPLCKEIGENLESGLAARRYAMSGERRALYGPAVREITARYRHPVECHTAGFFATSSK